MSELDTDNLIETLLASVATYIPAHEVEPEDDFAVVPNGYKLKDLEDYHDAPRRVVQTFEAETLDGFLDYFNRYATGNSTIFALEADLRIEAVLDYHDEDGAPGWRDHRIVYELPPSEDWKAFAAKDGSKMPQRQFADFLEEHEPLFFEPDAATMLEVARNFRAKKDVSFASKIDERSGDILFNYQTKTKSKGQLKAPRTFTLALQPFRGSSKYEVEAKLRHRVDDEGGLTLWYDLVRPESVVKDAFDKVLHEIGRGTRTGHIYRGRPK
jgi:uncharacterized protein YfdQ (DUF2303 family)